MFALLIFMYTLLGAAIVLASPTPAVNGLNARSIEHTARKAPGANCNGNVLCLSASAGASDLVGFIDNIQDDAWFDNGAQIGTSLSTRRYGGNSDCLFRYIACTSAAICAFLQGTNGGSGSWIKSLAHYIKDDAGCKICGSVGLPIYE